MFDRVATESYIEWLVEFEEFKKGKLAEIAKEYNYDVSDPYSAYCDWSGSPPDAEYCRPNWDKSTATWYQVYETVSEGTPVSPPFETADQLIEYLVANGDFWDQKRRKAGNSFMSCEPWLREAAEKFVKGWGWAPSLIISSKGVQTGVEALADL